MSGGGSLGGGEPGRLGSGSLGGGEPSRLGRGGPGRLGSGKEYPYQGGGTGNPYPGGGRENLCGGRGTGKAILDITYTMENLWLCQKFRRFI